MRRSLGWIHFHRPSFLIALPVIAALGLLVQPPDRAGAADRMEPAGGSGTGRLAGTVEVGPELDSRRMRFSLYPEPARAAGTAAAPAEKDAEVRNVVVYFEKVEAPGRRPPAAPAETVIRQVGLTFVPHVVAVLAGSSVAFPNADPVYHNVFSLSRKAAFDLGRYPEGRSKSVRFDEPGIVKVFCHIHSDMSALVVVLDNPYFTMPGADGRYAIEGVPPGAYRVIAWHERARPLKATVRIEPGHTSVLDLRIPLTEATGG